MQSTGPYSRKGISKLSGGFLFVGKAISGLLLQDRDRDLPRRSVSVPAMETTQLVKIDVLSGKIVIVFAIKPQAFSTKLTSQGILFTVQV
ncbi:MAG: hypothetical protein R3B47_19910 [Bacteroidia bacterium]